MLHKKSRLFAFIAVVILCSQVTKASTSNVRLFLESIKGAWYYENKESTGLLVVSQVDAETYELMGEAESQGMRGYWSSYYRFVDDKILVCDLPDCSNEILNVVLSSPTPDTLKITQAEGADYTGYGEYSLIDSKTMKYQSRLKTADEEFNDSYEYKRHE